MEVREALSVSQIISQRFQNRCPESSKSSFGGPKISRRSLHGFQERPKSLPRQSQECNLGVLGGSWEDLGSSWSALGASWRGLGRPLGSTCEHFGGKLEVLGGHFGVWKGDLMRFVEF